jgi:hypothetical protein
MRDADFDWVKTHPPNESLVNITSNGFKARVAGELADGIVSVTVAPAIGIAKGFVSLPARSQIGQIDRVEAPFDFKHCGQRHRGW